MDPRACITVTLLVCLIVSGPVWAQGEPPVCPCWTAEQLEEGVSAVCLEGKVFECGRFTEPGTFQNTGVTCLKDSNLFQARTHIPLGASDQPSTCEFLLAGKNISNPDLTQAGAAACRADVLRVCAQLNP